MPAPFSILHLSDLHLGPHCRFAGLDMTKLAERFASSVTDTMRVLAPEERIALVIVTGDIAEAGLPRHYADARAFFDGLVGALGLPRSRFLFVPGNHDISWPHCKIAEQQQSLEGFDDAELARRIAEVKLQPYRAFLAGFYGCAQGELEGVTSLGHDAFVHGFDDLGVSVALLDSCERESHRPPHGGKFSERQAQALMNVWRHDADRLRIVAIHHNPVAVVPANVIGWIEHLRKKADKGALDDDLLAHFEADTLGMDGRDLLRRVTDDAQVSLLLHGHHHTLAPRETWTWERRGPGQTHVLAAGSWGVDAHGLPPDQPLAVHLVRVDPVAGSMRSLRMVYEPRARQHGHVAPGDFVIDPAEPHGCALSLALPASLHARITATARASSPNAQLATQEQNRTDVLAARARKLVQELRVRSQERFARWDLGSVGVIAAQDGRRAVAAGLDEMYLPLRLHPRLLPDHVEAGAPMLPEDLLARTHPLIIRGPAGTGKTTWMRWTFRRLVQNEQALPFLIELRDLARKWNNAEGSERTLDAYLHGRVAERVGMGWADELHAVLPWLLEDDAGPRPVLLVDGWDELGDLGDELREKLAGFLRRHPRVLAVVTSRPYGEGQPTHSDRYDVLEIQRLSDAEVETMAVRFFGMMHAGDPPAAEAAVVRFRDDLTASQEALALARTTLMLTMMLLISRARRLPDKRHELYQACIDNLLTARPDDREKDAARLGPVQWRPDDSGERWRAVDALAAQAQLASYAGARRSQIVLSWKDAIKLLPPEWDGAEGERRKRSGFLHWLIDAAGVMVDHADGTITFAHLSFQEYLTARYLQRTREGDDARIELCRPRMSNLAWWETLRLWAAMVHERDPDKLTPVLKALIHGAIPEPDANGNAHGFEKGEEFRTAGFWLAGVMLADGVGTEDVFDHWVFALRDQFWMLGSVYWEECARAWAYTRQHQRRVQLSRRWADVVSSMTCLRWFRAKLWYQQAGIEAPATLPDSQAALVLAPLARDGIVTGATETAFARVLAGATPWWPSNPSDLIFLRLWPGARPRLGMRLQTFFALGASQVEVEPILSQLCTRLDVNKEITRDLARKFSWSLTGSLDGIRARGLSWDWAQELARDWFREHAWHWAGDLPWYWAGEFAWYLKGDWERHVDRNWAQNLENFLIHNLRGDWARSLGKYFASYWGLSSEPPWLRDVAWIDLTATVGRASSRAVMAKNKAHHHRLARLFRAACRASLDETPDTPALVAALAALPADVDPLWPALARHLAHCATTTDRELLIDLARHPEKREPPLQWGLRYFVRGDVVFPDGTERTLDELCARAGLPALPYLEDLPPEIDLSDLDSDVPTS